MNLRTHKTKNETVLLAGRNDKTNEELIAQVAPEELVFHTDMAGSPFVNIKGTPKTGDIKEAATLCARYSRDYKKNKTDTTAHYFFGKNISKTKQMKTGTFAVKNTKKIKIKLTDIEAFHANPLKKGEIQNLINERKNIQT